MGFSSFTSQCYTGLHPELKINFHLIYYNRQYSASWILISVMTLIACEVAMPLGEPNHDGDYASLKSTSSIKLSLKWMNSIQIYKSLVMVISYWNLNSMKKDIIYYCLNWFKQVRVKLVVLYLKLTFIKYFLLYQHFINVKHYVYIANSFLEIWNRMINK